MSPSPLAGRAVSCGSSVEVPSPSGVDDTNAFEDAIGAAVRFGRSLYIPGDGIYIVKRPLNLNEVTGLRIYGDGPRSRIDVRTGGRELFCGVGMVNCTFEDFFILGPQNDPPSAAFILGRKDISSAGLHNFARVTIEGWYTHAGVVSMSSEDNRYSGCTITNRQNASSLAPDKCWAFSCSSNNDTGIVPSFGALDPSPTGGNTVHKFTDCSFAYLGQTPHFGGCVRISGRQLHFAGCFFTASEKGECGLKIYGTSGLTIMGGTGEVYGSDAGIVFDGTISSAFIEGFHGGALVGRDGSRVQSSHISGFFSGAPWGIDLYDAENCHIRSRGNGVNIRGANVNNDLLDGGTVDLLPGGLVGFNPAKTNGFCYRTTEGRSDGHTIHRIHVGDVGSRDGGTSDMGSDTRGELGQARAYVWQDREQLVPFATHITPKVRDGGLMHIVVTGPCTFHPPSDILGSAGNPEFDVGIRFEVVFENTGSFPVALAGITAPGWAATLGAGAYTTLRVRLLRTGVFLGTF